MRRTAHVDRPALSIRPTVICFLHIHFNEPLFRAVRRPFRETRAEGPLELHTAFVLFDSPFSIEGKVIRVDKHRQALLLTSIDTREISLVKDPRWNELCLNHS
jgi:hypothetical protein